MNPQFYCVLSNRDMLKVRGERIPIWQFLPDQHHYLTSLVYSRGFTPPTGAHLFLDCGAWSYKHLPEPRWSPEECSERYAELARPGEIVAAPDHMVLRCQEPEEQEHRIGLTLTNARRFLAVHPDWCHPLAVTHGKTVETRIGMTRELLDMGYRYIAIGSVAVQAGNRRFITTLLEETAKIKAEQPFYLHVLGISALSYYWTYKDHLVDSYDGSSMFFSAFTAGEWLWHRGHGALQEWHAIKPEDDGAEDLLAYFPACGCAACAAMGEQGIDTRRYGSNEHNMGRAVHNIGQYLSALKVVSSQRPEGARRLGL